MLALVVSATTKRQRVKFPCFLQVVIVGERVGERVIWQRGKRGAGLGGIGRNLAGQRVSGRGGGFFGGVLFATGFGGNAQIVRRFESYLARDCV